MQESTELPGFSGADRGQSPWYLVGLSFIVLKRSLAAGRQSSPLFWGGHLKVEI